MREEARARATPLPADVLASDVDPASISLARANAKDSGVHFRVEERDIAELRPTAPSGFVVTNPPYGERVAADAGLYKRIAEALDRLEGHTVCILAGTPDIERAIGRRPTRWLALFNGAIECRLLTYELPGA